VDGELCYYLYMRKITHVVLVVIIITVLVAIFIPKPCDYDNFAWGRVHKECDCLGIKVDNSCKTPDGYACPDAGGGNVCIGIVTGRR